MAHDFLKLIVDHKKKEVEEAEHRVPEKELRDMAAGKRKRRPFFKRLEKPGPSGVNVIAEIKRASPSKGDIRPGLDPAVYAAEYEAGGAAAISVLTDTEYFRGGPEDLKNAREATSLPVLRKDFLVSSYQIYESAVMGADAVLLIVRILSPGQLESYLALCAELGLDALVEVNSEKDMVSASTAGAKLIGINNRDLSSFKTDVKTAMHLVSMLDTDQVAVAASGISSREDIDKNIHFNIYNFLIGESLVRAEHTRDFLRSLACPPGSCLKK